MSNKPDIIAWCDGSYRGGKKVSKGCNSGGFVIYETATGKEKSYSRLFNRLTNSRRHGSMVAEFRAVTAALCQAPKSDHVHIINDNKSVIRALQSGALSESTWEKAEHTMHVAFRQAMLALQCHEHVSFQWKSRNSKMMRKAHNLANDATKPPKAKAA